MRPFALRLLHALPFVAHFRLGVGLLFGVGCGAITVARADEATDAAAAPPSLLQTTADAIMATADPTDATRGNRVLNLERGDEALLLRVHLIRQARRSIEIQTFIWTNDECGRLIICELVEAARRGVKVRIIADHMVSDQDPAVGAFLATVSPNLEVRHYRPVMARLHPTLLQKATAAVWGFHGLNQRMHNKLMVVDGIALLTGGRNIENTYFNHSITMNFRDREVLAVGPVAQAAAASFEQYWSFRHTVPGTALRDVAAVIAQGDFPRYETRADYDFGGYFTGLDAAAGDPAQMRSRCWDRLQPVERVTFLADEPGKGAGFFGGDSRTTKALREQVAAARSEVILQSPYLILSRAARRLGQTLKRDHPGMVLRVSTNSFASTDNTMAYSANYRLRSAYVEQLGLEIYEFKPQPAVLHTLFPDFPAIAARAQAEGRTTPPFFCLHAKSLVMDGRVTFVGSYNLDPRSMSLNTEVGLLIEDAAFAQTVRAEIERDMAPDNSWVINRRQYPLALATVNGLIDGILSLGPVDPWPLQNTSSFELNPDAAPVPRDDPTFYQCYHDAGDFPGSAGPLSTKEILTRLYKAVGPTLTPIM